MEQLDFKSKSLVSDVMLTWCKELNPRKAVCVTHPVEGSSVGNWHQNLLASVEENDRGWIVSDVGRMIEIQWASRRASFRESDW